MVDIVLKKLCLVFLLLSGVISSSAMAGHRDERDNQQFDGRRPHRESRQPNGGNWDAGPGPSYNPPPEQRRPGRMSPEERRALRRQINEAGQDIYAPRR